MKTIKVTLLATLAMVAGCVAGCGTATAVGDPIDRAPGTSAIHDAWPGCEAAGAFTPGATAPANPDATAPTPETTAPTRHATAPTPDTTAPTPDATAPTMASSGRPGPGGTAVFGPEVSGWIGAGGLGQDALRLPRLGQDFVAQAAVVCGGGPAKRDDGGTDAVLTESRATDVAALVDAIRLPDQTEPQTEPQRGELICLMDMPAVPWLVLIDPDGRWTRPGIPVDACGKPRIEVREALDALALTRVTTRVTGEVESAEAAATRCGQSWADMVWVETHSGNATPGRITAPPLAGSDLRVCVFEVPDSEKGGGKPAGEFVHGGEQNGSEILEAVVAAPPARACDTPAERFAVIGAGDGHEIYVELDGCQRIMVTPVTGGPIVAQGDDALARLLD